MRKKRFSILVLILSNWKRIIVGVGSLLGSNKTSQFFIITLVQSAFFEAERSTKADETTDAVVTQSDMKKNKTKDQTIPVFAEDGDGVKNRFFFSEV